MNEGLLQRFRQLVSAQLGFQKNVLDQATFRRSLEARIQILKRSPEQYYQLLAAEISTAETGCHLEWQALIHLIAVRESYFFRDQGQFSLLREQILPELIARGQATRSLRIWSAGCSTGEEAYSLAILIGELIPDWTDWNLLIVGTDVNQQAIAQARQGIYDAWSFRWVEPRLQQRYFRQRPAGWEIDPTIRSRVTFQTHNLVQTPTPAPERGLSQIDLILCRNVFIYFDANAIAQVLQKFSETLNLGGYLITGHAELHSQQLNAFQARVLPESVVYQRPLSPGDRPLQPSSALPSVALPSSALPSVALPSTALPSAALPIKSPAALELIAEETEIKTGVPTLEQVKMSLEAGNDAEAIAQAQYLLAHHFPGHHLPSHQPVQSAAYELIAQAQANLGDYDQAELACQQAIGFNALAIAPHYLLAQIAEEQGRLEDAKQLLKKIIYIMPSWVPAYLRLGDLYEQEGNTTRARKMQAAAMKLLEEVPSRPGWEY